MTDFSTKNLNYSSNKSKASILNKLNRCNNMSPPATVPVIQSANSPSSSSSASRTTSNGGDTLFEPSVEMMVNDFDDERTLEEEEALAASEAEDPSAELSSLQRERDMPIEELLALYNCHGRSDDSTVGAEDAGSTRPRSSSSSSNNENESEEQNGVDKENEESELRNLYPETFSSEDQRHLRTLSQPQSEEEDDGDYSPEEDDFKKTIMVGSEFQAVIPEGLCKYGDVLPYENDDKLVWDPSKLREQEVINYEQKSNMISHNHKSTSVLSIPVGNHLRDDEQTLYLLLQCGHNVEEALRRRRINAIPMTDAMSQWSEEECRNFENGLRMYGKDFHTIQQLKVKTRAVGELVQFYYLWKKTERHDVFANKARLEKKKYSLHPGLTDYMDRFLEEQECNGGIGGNSGTATNNTGGGNGGNGNSNIGIRDRSTSPGVNCLLYTNYRRQRGGNEHHQSITDPLALGDNEVFTNTSSPSNLRPKEPAGHYSLNTSKL